MTICYPGATITEVENENSPINPNVAFKVHLSDGNELYFDANGGFLFADDNGTDDNILISNLPSVIITYVQTNYPGVTITEAEQNPATLIYKLHLSNGLELYFQGNGTFIGADTDDNGSGGGNNIPIADLPQAALDYIAAVYPSATIVEAKLLNNGNYKAELNTNIELIFDPNGQFLFVDDDTNGSGSGIPISELPANIISYIETNYPTATIVEADIEDNGFYKVHLNNGMELIFDANGNFIGSDNGTLPQVIVDYIDANYSGISIVDNEQFATTVYKVDLSNNYTLFFEGDGTFIFEDAENDVNISFSALPTAAQNYINSNFAGVPIDQVKKWNNSNHYRVKLDDDEGTRVYFRPSGAHLGTDN